MDMPSPSPSSNAASTPATNACSTPQPFTPLPHLAVLEVQGPEAGVFLQGQLTQDVVSMDAVQARAGGYCSAKGRLLANFVIVHPQAEVWWLVLRSGLVESLTRRLRMFVLRAKCTVTPRPDLAVHGLWSSPLPTWAVATAGAGQGAEPAALEIGWWGHRGLRIEGQTDASAQAAAAPTVRPSPDMSIWDHADVLAGWPWIEPGTVEQFVPQMLNFEVLGGVNFRKGCYPGQEVVARSQYRGTLKRRMGLFAVQAAVASPGTEVFHSEDTGQPAGMVVIAASDPQQPEWTALLIEHKTVALASGTLHLGQPDGPVLAARALPYAIPTEA